MVPSAACGVSEWFPERTYMLTRARNLDFTQPQWWRDGDENLFVGDNTMVVNVQIADAATGDVSAMSVSAEDGGEENARYVQAGLGLGTVVVKIASRLGLDPANLARQVADSLA